MVLRQREERLSSRRDNFNRNDGFYKPLENIEFSRGFNIVLIIVL